MATNFSNLSQVPLLSEDNIEDSRLQLTKLAEASAALSQGKLPSSDQLASMVQKLLKSNILQPKLGARIAGRVGGGQMSPKGEEVIASARGVLEALVRVGMEKNGDDKVCFPALTTNGDGQLMTPSDNRFSASFGPLRRLRSMLMSMLVSSGVSESDRKLTLCSIATPDIPLPTSEEIQEANRALRQLASLLLTSNNLRDIIGDIVNLGRDLFADAAEQVANAAIQTTKASKRAARKVRPTEEERKKSKTGLEGKDIPSAKKLQKQAVRSLEDARDDAEDAIHGKVSEVSSTPSTVRMTADPSTSNSSRSGPMRSFPPTLRMPSSSASRT